ncbi:MAG: aldehyde dehydrogenase family protein [Hyphomicrobiaceae bacterium]
MNPALKILADSNETEGALKARADMVLERAKWAAEVFHRYDRGRTFAIAEAVANAAFQHAERYAEWAVRETGFGVVEHKRIKNELTSRAFLDYYRDWDFVSPRTDQATKIVEIPRPAGVIFALIPSTNPISTVNFKILCAMMTRNAIVVSPHPAARECSVDAARLLARAAEEAGAPDGIIQVIERPTLALIEEFMGSDKTDVILATGGTAMVRSAYSSSNPAIGVGPGNAPVMVDESADLKLAAGHIVESKSFDNSVLCTNESVLITLAAVEKELARELTRAGCHVCSEEETSRLRAYLFHERGFNVEALGRDATWIAEQAGIRVANQTKVLVTPIDLIGVDEPLSREKLCPVLAMFVADSRSQALTMARAVLRFTGAGHSAAIHSRDPQTIVDYAAAVEVYRVVVNAPCSQGAAGFQTNLAPTFTIGTGFYGRSSIGENIGPQHLVHWTRIAFHKGERDLAGSISRASMDFKGPLPEAPSDGVPGKSAAALSSGRGMARGGGGSGGPAPSGDPSYHQLREEIRRIIAQELAQALKG